MPTFSLAGFFEEKNWLLVMSGWACGAFLVNVWVNFWQIQFSRKVFNLRSLNFTQWFLQGLCFHVMPCSFQLVPNVLVKNAFFGHRYFFIFIFSQISVYIP